jgi:uncharacterized protein (DUF169 family)
MSQYQTRSDQLTTALALSVPPIAIAFSDVVPSGVPSYLDVVPAGCVFWQEAASRTFATSAKDHELCSIGVHTHNIAGASPSQHSELEDTLSAMSGLNYVRQDEVAAIPVVNRESRFVLYGPLADFPLDPNVVLLFTHAQQGLIVTEAVARVDGGAPFAMGRPACAVVPQVLNQGFAAMSLGCCGARTYLAALPASMSLWALPGSRLAAYCDQIAAFAGANETLTVFHARRKADIESGERPTVRDSLERLSS